MLLRATHITHVVRPVPLRASFRASLRAPLSLRRMTSPITTTTTPNGTAAAKRQLRRVGPDASPAELETVAKALKVAFDQDSITHAVSGDNQGLRLARMRASVTTSALDMECWVVDGEGEVEAVMLVKPPGFEHGKTPNSTGPHTEAVLAENQTPQQLAAYDVLKKAFHDIEVAAFGPRAVTDMYYISHIGIVPDAQGKGLGGLCLEYMVNRGKKEGKNVSLLTMTPRHEAYYKRFGFETRARSTADLAGITTNWWCMSTEP